MAKKIIRFGLSEKELSQAIKQVEQYKKDLNKKCQLLVQALTDRGVEIAKINVQSLGAYYTGELENSIDGYFSPSTGVGIIYAGSFYAVYVEFGTGIQGDRFSHALAGKLGYVYDINNHGDNGWIYFNEKDGKYHWTTGMPSRPFMYMTAMELEKKCEEIAKEVFKK